MSVPNGLRQGWLVARREVRERSRSRGFYVGLAVMLLVVVAAIVAPAALEDGVVSRDVGLVGAIPEELPRVVAEQGDAADVTVRVHRYGDVAVGQEAVRDDAVDVLVVDARRLEWRGEPDEQLRAVVTGAVQVVAVQQRADAVGLDAEDVAALVAPVPVENIDLGSAPGRSADDDTAAIVMSILLLTAIATYGSLVLTGVVEEKSSRVVEVLLARMPARSLLVGKIAGIGLLGFAQFLLTALAALVATLLVDSVDLPAVRASVLAWVVAWFVLGYTTYAMAYGALGSLASRTEDAQSVAGPAVYVLLASYWGSFVAVSADPAGGWSRLLSLFPGTAPFAMPARIALGATSWWEPVLAVALTLAAIAGLVAVAGRVYTGAILRTGPTLKLREAWRGATAPARDAAGASGRAGRRRSRASPTGLDGRAGVTRPEPATGRWSIGAPILAGGVGVAVAIVARDVIAGVAVGAALFAVVTRFLKARAGDDDRHARPP